MRKYLLVLVLLATLGGIYWGAISNVDKVNGEDDALTIEELGELLKRYTLLCKQLNEMPLVSDS